MSDNANHYHREENRTGRSPQAEARQAPDGGQIVYPNDFKPTHSVAHVFAAVGWLRATKSCMPIRRMSSSPAGSWRSGAWAKPLSFTFRTGAARLQVYARKTSSAMKPTALFQHLRHRRSGRRLRPSVSHQDQGADARSAGVSAARPNACGRCRRNGMGSPMSKRVTASVMSI